MNVHIHLCDIYGGVHSTPFLTVEMDCEPLVGDTIVLTDEQLSQIKNPTTKHLENHIWVVERVIVATEGEQTPKGLHVFLWTEPVKPTDKDFDQSIRVIVAGGRDFQNYDLLKVKCDFFIHSLASLRGVSPENFIIVSGKAKGADSLGERYAKEFGYTVEEYPANWEKFGKSAGYRRNAEMAEVADALIAFWDGQSRGTAHMISLAKSKGLYYEVVHY